MINRLRRPVILKTLFQREGVLTWTHFSQIKSLKKLTSRLTYFTFFYVITLLAVSCQVHPKLKEFCESHAHRAESSSSVNSLENLDYLTKELFSFCICNSEIVT